MAFELFVPPSRALSANADPYSGALANFYATGTSNRQSVYTTAALNVAHQNPVVADAGGNFAPIYFNPALQYRVVVTNSTGAVTLHDIDPVNPALMAAFSASGGSALLGFLAGGTGSVARTGQAKMRDVVSIMDKGANGAGTVIDTTALQSLVTDIGTYGADYGKGGYIPSGLYRLDATTTPQSNMRLHGDGPKASVFRNDVVPIATIPVFTKTSGGLGFATFENLGARGQKSFLDVTGDTDNLHFADLWLAGMAEAGLRFEGACYTSQFHRIEFDTCVDGISIVGLCNNNTIADCEFKDLTGHAISLSGSEDLTVIGCRFEGPIAATKAVLRLNSGFNQVTFVGGYVEGAQRYLVDGTGGATGIVSFVGTHFTYYQSGTPHGFQNTSGIKFAFYGCHATEAMEVPQGSIVENCTNIYAALSTVASAATVTLPQGAVVQVTGTTTITGMTAGNANAGRQVTLIFQDALTFTDGSNLKLAGNFVTTADDTCTLVCDGTNWFEIGRSVN